MIDKTLEVETTENKTQPESKPLYWRSLEHLENDPSVREFVEREFPAGASEFNGGEMSRRSFLKVMGASMALAGLAGCRRPAEKIVPYVKKPENIVPGIANYYATAMPSGINAYGLVVKSREGRPIKIEGNEQHPTTLGSSSSMMQAELLNLFDPDRSQKVINKGEQKSWDDFIAFWRARYVTYRENGGRGLAVISEPFRSPSMAALKNDFQKRFPNAQWISYAPISDENLIKGSAMATGLALQPICQFDKADIILTLDADVFGGESNSVRAAKDFSKRRRVAGIDDTMSRLYAVEGNFSLTGGMADHRLAIATSEVGAFAAALALELRTQGLILPAQIVSALKRFNKHTFDGKWLKAVAKDLLVNRRRGIIVAGRRQPAAVHALVFALNRALANVGQGVTYTRLTDAMPSDADSLSELVQRMHNGDIETLVMFGGNPAYDAPVDLKFNDALAKVKHSIHLAGHLNETSALTGWHLPESHFLESWMDVASIDGTVSVVQPLIKPLYQSRSKLEVAHAVVNGEFTSGYDLVRASMRRVAGAGFGDKAWRRLLHEGVLANSANTTFIPNTNVGLVAKALRGLPLNNSTEGFELVFTSSNHSFDGRNLNNAWLMETPDPVSMLTWDNAALVGSETAKKLGVKKNDMLQITTDSGDLKIAAWVVPGIAAGTVVLPLGFGRKKVGRVGQGRGFNTYKLRTQKSRSFASNANVKRHSGKYELATTQDHWSMEDRPIIREDSLAGYRKHPTFAKDMVKHPPLKSMWKEREYNTGYQWGMAIDLSVCNGCGGCTTACQSENNIPVVGKEQVILNREMNWIRVDRYFSGSPDNPQMRHQPVTCQHCENAPCEQVCPVAATVHDKEGLNNMVYNRCIGTRYCANNCPYKVRRFNYFNFTNKYPEVQKMTQNPDVTVRSRGVMEKCSFCSQRINEAKHQAKMEGRQVKDGEIKTACQQACPTDAIVFGNVNDPNSKVSKIKKQNRNYELLIELNVKPRNSYLARLSNPNPELEG